jgi:hypothetical protein
MLWGQLKWLFTIEMNVFDTFDMSGFPLGLLFDQCPLFMILYDCYVLFVGRNHITQLV